MSKEKNSKKDSVKENCKSQKVKEWFSENLRIIISLLVVIVIFGSIYVYSNRTDSDSVDVASNNEEENSIEKILEDLSAKEGSENKNEDVNDNSKADDSEQDNSDEAIEKEEKEVSDKKESVASAQETEESFIEVAQEGDSETTLARKALTHYLEKNFDSQITNAHKIYIEDYLTKNNNDSGDVGLGDQMEFSKDLIKEAVDSSKNLNDAQIDNLQGYANLVSF